MNIKIVGKIGTELIKYAIFVFGLVIVTVMNSRTDKNEGHVDIDLTL